MEVSSQCTICPQVQSPLGRNLQNKWPMMSSVVRWRCVAMMVASVAVLKALPVEEHHLATLSAHFRRLASGREAKRVGDLRENFLGKRGEQVASGGGGVFNQRLGSKVKQVVSKTYNRTGHLNKDFKPDLRDPRHLRIRPPRSPDVRKWNNSCRCRGRPSRGGRRPEWWL